MLLVRCKKTKRQEVRGHALTHSQMQEDEETGREKRMLCHLQEARRCSTGRWVCLLVGAREKCRYFCYGVKYCLLSESRSTKIQKSAAVREGLRTVRCKRKRNAEDMQCELCLPKCGVV